MITAKFLVDAYKLKPKTSIKFSYYKDTFTLLPDIINYIDNKYYYIFEIKIYSSEVSDSAIQGCEYTMETSTSINQLSFTGNSIPFNSRTSAQIICDKLGKINEPSQHYIALLQDTICAGKPTVL